jgi:TRAP-type C4-dicarboxylate transport system permease small subunit
VKNAPVKFLNDHLEESLLVLLLATMSLLIGAQIFMRYVMGASLTWSEELARYCFIWATHVGVAYAVRKHMNISVTLGADMLPDRYRGYLNILAYVIFGVFAALVVKEGFFLMQKIFGFGQKSSSLGIPMGFVYMAPVVGFSLVLLRLLQAIRGEIVKIRKGEM